MELAVRDSFPLGIVALPLCLFMGLLVVFYPRTPLKEQLLEGLMGHLAVHTSRKRNESNDECLVTSEHTIMIQFMNVF